MTTRLAHLSDLHILDVEGVPWHRFLNKRVTGAVNLLTARRDAHPVAILEAAVADLRALAPDHVLITGDLTNLSLPTEFERVRGLLAPLGGHDRLSMVPGNHDLYTRGAARAKRFEEYFGDLLWEDGAERPWPWFKRVGEVNVLGFCSAHPVAPLFAHGWVTEAQLARARALAAEHDFAGRFTVALLHHNLHPRSTRKDAMHGLRNRDEVLDACAGLGVDLLLHGHTHAAHRFAHDGMDVIGCGSSTWNTERPEHVARYNVYHVGADGALDDVEVRIYDPDRGAFSAA